jgi:hypothetical protein
MYRTLHTRSTLAAATVAIAMALAPAAAAAPTAVSVLGLVDPGTGVLADRGPSSDGGARFIPGVTDSGTGVLRERERRGLDTPTSTRAGDSGFGVDEAAVTAGAALAATAAAASLALLAGVRRRRPTTGTPC